jgi:nucleotide-binding universal stress UspA family protein
VTGRAVGSIVVGVDGSLASAVAVSYASDLAERRGLALRLVSAYEKARSVDTGAHRCRPAANVTRRRYTAELLLGAVFERAQLRHPQMEILRCVTPGSAARVLVREARAADVLVLGLGGKAGSRHLGFRSTTTKVVARARVPLIAVPAAAEAPTQTRSGIVVGLDPVEPYDAVLEFAFRAAWEMRETLTAVHAWRLPAPVVGPAMPVLVGDRGVIAGVEWAALEHTLAGWADRFPEVRLEKKVVRAHASTALLDEASCALLLVIGCRAGADETIARLGSVARHVLTRTETPVAVVHIR